MPTTMLQQVPEAPNLHDSVATPSESAASRGPGPENGPDRRPSWYVRAKFSVVRAFLWGWARVFSLRGLYLFGQIFGTLEYLINFKRRARYRRELHRIFPEGLSRFREKRIILRYFRRTRCDKLFYLIIDLLPKDKIMRRFKFHGRDHVNAALERGHGLYIMFSHHGAQHVAGLLMALLGDYSGAYLRDRNEGPLRIYMRERYRKRFPEYAALRILYADTYPRDIYRLFEENRIVASALDVSRVRGVTLKTSTVRVFGENREFLNGTLRIALRCKATVLQGFVISRPNYYYRLVLTDPLYVPQAGADPAPELIGGLMQQYANNIESHVRSHPDHLSRA